MADGKITAKRKERKAHDYNKKVHKHVTNEGYAKVEFTKQTVELQRENQEVQMWAQEVGRNKEWNRANIIQGLKRSADMKAWDKSERFYGDQLGLNVEAARGASSGADNRRYEREIELELNKRKTNLAADGSKLKLDAFRKEAAFKGQSNFLEGIQNIGAVSYNTGRSAVKETVSALSKTAGIAAALSDQINSQESQYNLELLGFDIDRLGHAETGLSIKRKHTAELSKIEHQLNQANLQADARRLAKPMMMPPVPKPQALPRQEFQDPREYVPGPKPVKGALNYQAIGGGGGGGGGGVGAALGTAGGLMSSLAGTSIGFMGAGTLSFGAALGPIGVGVAAVGALGEIFDWW